MPPDVSSRDGAKSPKAALADLLAALTFETPQVRQSQKIDVFTGPLLQAGWRRIFGGLVVAQALAATCRTVATWQPNALHGLFLRPGDPALPIRFEVERTRDGQSFAARHCRAFQNETEIFAALISFHKEEAGFDHAEPMPQVLMPDVLSPDVLSPDVQITRPEPLFEQEGYKRWFALHEGMIEMRPAQRSSEPGQQALAVAQPRLLWMRAIERLPDEPSIHRAVLAYMSDMSLLDCALVPHEKSVFDADVQAASLDHAIWFHRPVRADDWLLYVQDSPNASGGRGLTRGAFYSAAGVLVASIAQEGLIRPRV